MTDDWTYLTRATSFDNAEVCAVFLSTPTSLVQWHPNYGVWVKIKLDSLRTTIQIDEAMQRVNPGSNPLIHRVDRATAMAAGKALKPYPHLPVVSGELLRTMAEAVLFGRSFESLGIADTTLNRLRFSGLEDDYHFHPKGEEWIVLDPGGEILVFGGDWSSVDHLDPAVETPTPADLG